jgi:hypothetical protein
MTTIISGDTGISPVTASGTSASVDGMTVGRGGGEVSTNTAVGASALNANTTAAQCVAIGYQAAYSQTNPDGNSAFGYQAMYSNATGANSVAVGRRAAYTATDLDNTVAIGAYALTTNTTGDNNTAVGKDALYSNTTASNSVAVGYQAAYTSNTYITAVGYQALKTATGTENTAVGYNAGALITTGGGNTIVGERAAQNMTTGSTNTLLGSYVCGDGVLTGSQNTAVGRQAFQAGTSGSGNTIFGYLAGALITTGTENCCIGTGAGYNQVGITTGGQNTFIGNYAGGTSTSAGQFQVAIGYNVQSAGNNGYVTIGHNTGVDRIYCQYTANATWTRVSDLRTKKDVQDGTLGLEFINKLRTVTYKKRAPSEMASDFAFYDESETDVIYKKKLHGFIAQEVKQALDEVGESDFTGWHEMENGVQGVSYEMFVVPLIKSVQELKTIVDAQAALISGQATEIAELKAKVG